MTKPRKYPKNRKSRGPHPENCPCSVHKPRKRGPWSDKQREKSSQTSFKKGQIPWNKGIKMPDMKIDKEQRSRALQERWDNDPEYAAKARAALESVRHEPKSESARLKMSVSGKARVASHLENCECPMCRHYQTPDGIENMANFFRGRKLTEEHILKIFKSLDEHCPDCKCGYHNLANIETNLEKILYRWLSSIHYEFVKKKRFGSKEVDAYLPEPYHLAFEADGDRWHRDKEYDIKRDKYLLERFNLIVIRITEKELLSLEKIV